MEIHNPELEKKSIPSSGYEAEREIKKIINELHYAVLARDVDKIMTFYSPDIIAFDMIPPLQFTGKEAYRKSWEKTFEDSKNDKSVGFDLHDLKIITSGDIAFCHELHHSFGIHNGEEMDMWMRATHCFKKINGRWLIVHEHFSIPVDSDSGMGMINSVPEKKYH